MVIKMISNSNPYKVRIVECSDFEIKKLDPTDSVYISCRDKIEFFNLPTEVSPSEELAKKSFFIDVKCGEGNVVHYSPYDCTIFVMENGKTVDKYWVEL